MELAGHMLQGGGGSSAGGPRPAERSTRLPPPHHHVLPSLKARQAVQTCVLSTRWRHLWRSVPCLDVDIVEFRTKAATPVSSSGRSDSSSDSDSGNNQDKGEGWDEFEDFTVNLMLRCNIALLDSFRFDIDRGSEPLFYGCSSSRAALGSWAYSGRQAAAWLRRAMKYCTPGSGFGAGPLHLCEIRSIASDSLKNLVLKRSLWGRFLSDIVSPTLNTLVINGGSNENRNLLAISVSAPMVVDLHLDVHGGCFRGGISMNEMPSLDRASIRLRGHKYSLSKTMSGSKLGGDQSRAPGFFVVLGKEPAFQEFQNLRNLLLGECDLSDDFRILRLFLRGSPNLEKVTLRHSKFQVILRTRKERANWTKPHLLVAAVAWTYYVMRTSSLKSYIKMVMPVDLLMIFCTTYQIPKVPLMLFLRLLLKIRCLIQQELGLVGELGTG
ncbi:unnamed protein product [Miscanthus lutarioriparius]|uniref:FBD domain-containing protein n=1 Tax=Miscanthus lutarioriparius TaxID=422564 RepID=A0A811QI24_9POAL|nr:unnamed protein product [Miscanthus lutarioriparius]